MNHTEFESLIRNGARGHFVGIGGVSMSALAEVLLEKGITVTGSDVNESDAVKHLRQIGIAVAIGHDAKNVEGADFLVRTAAARDDNPEVMAARKRASPSLSGQRPGAALCATMKTRSACPAPTAKPPPPPCSPTCSCRPRRIPPS